MVVGQGREEVVGDVGVCNVVKDDVQRPIGAVNSGERAAQPVPLSIAVVRQRWVSVLQQSDAYQPGIHDQVRRHIHLRRPKTMSCTWLMCIGPQSRLPFKVVEKPYGHHTGGASLMHLANAAGNASSFLFHPFSVHCQLTRRYAVFKKPLLLEHKQHESQVSTVLQKNT